MFELLYCASDICKNRVATYVTQKQKLFAQHQQSPLRRGYKIRVESVAPHKAYALTNFRGLCISQMTAHRMKQLAFSDVTSKHSFELATETYRVTMKEDASRQGVLGRPKCKNDMF